VLLAQPNDGVRTADTLFAERLVVSEETVKTHVSHVFTKLAVRDRAQAAVVAYQVASSPL
jgi:DNA-binding NarL/FixJ family response regulator